MRDDTVEPGHRGLYFAPTHGGLRRDVLQPGKYRLGASADRVDDFDVTYSTKQEDVTTKSAEGLDLQLKLSVIYRPDRLGALRSRYRGRG